MKTENNKAAQKGNKNFRNENVLNFAFVGLFAVVLVSLAIGNAFAYSPPGNGVCNCSSCDDCFKDLDNNACTTVKLTADIINYSGTCIDNPKKFNNKTFDCQGHTISGFGYGNGIFLFNKTNDTIENCIITNFESGIDLWYSSNITSINNTVSSNTQFGIFLGEGSNNNSLILNHICNNSRSDIYSVQSNAATGDNNTCISSHNYHDEANVSGCKYICQIDSCNCSSCGECNYKLSSPSCSQVNLTKDITNDWGSCINNPQNFNNKVFNCQGHTITGFGYGTGIYLFNETNNTIKNCVITGFDTGIYLDLSPNNSIINDTVNNNKNYGIFLSYSSNTTMRNNIMENNANNFGIKGWEIFYFYQDIDKSNLINGKPIYYWTNKNAPNGCKNAVIDESTNASFVALISCDNITVKNLNLSKNSHGILLVNTTNSKISNNTANNNDYDGINLVSSSHNTLINNTANDNGGSGIYLSSSSHNTLINNTAKDNSFDIWFSPYSETDCDNIIENNTGSGNRPIKYFNHSVNLQNEILSELILCNADNSNISNVTIAGSDTLNNNGLFVYLTENSTFTNVNSSDNFIGIWLDSSSNNTLTNNTANNNDYDGINLVSSPHNTLINNTGNDNDYGIVLSSSSNIILTNNTAKNNKKYGIFLDFSSNNIINANRLCANREYDIYTMDDCNNNRGYNNTGDTYYNWNDKGVTGFTYSCPKCYVNDAGTCTIKTGEGCNCINQALNDVNCTVVKLNSSVINWAGTCIDEAKNFNTKTLDCQGYTISGDGSGTGILLKGKSNNTIKNCVITNFEYGIHLDSSFGNTLTNNTVNNNSFGIELDSSSNNTLTNNTANNNDYFGIMFGYSSNNSLIHNTADNNDNGIYLTSSSNNTLHNNTANNNGHDGIDLYSSSHNTLTHNTAKNNNGGISLGSSSNNTLTSNTAKNNGVGISLYFSSSYNTLIHNTANNNKEHGIYLGSSSNNTLTHNTANNNEHNGIYLSSSSNNTLTNNTANNTVYKDIAFLFLNPFYPTEVDNTNVICYLCYGSKIQGVKHPHHKMKESLEISMDTIQYTVDLGGIPVSTIKGDNDEIIDTSYRGKMLFMGSNEYFVNDLGKDYIVLAKGEKLNISSAGYTETTLPELEGYRFKLLNVTKWHGNPVGVEIEVEKPNGTTASVTATKQAGAQLGKDENGHQVQIQAFQVTGNTTIILVYDMGTKIKLENNKEMGGWNVEIRKNKCNEVGIEEYGNLTDPVGNANKSWCLTKLALIHNNRFGIYLSSSSNNTLTDNTANNNDYGTFLYYSSHNTLTNNTAENNTRYGISLYSSSSYNTLIHNMANNNKEHGISLDSSSNNNALTHNTAENNKYGIRLYSSSNNTLTHNTANNNWNGILLYYSSNNTLTHNTANSNNHTGIYIFGNSNFNKILGNKILNNEETGITLSDCVELPWGSLCDEGNLNNTIEGNEILNNTIGVFSNASNSIISDNFVCRNTQWDLYSPANWLSSSGDNNTCDNANGWNDINAKNGCKYECPKCKIPKDIFDIVKMLEYLSGQGSTTYCDLNNDNKIDLNDVFALIDKIVQN